MSPAEPLADPLSPRVRSLFQDLRQAGEVSAVAGGVVRKGEAGRARHGTRVRFSLRLDGCSVVEARYRAYGCPYTLAACEWLARRLQGMQLPALSGQGLAEAVGAPADWAEALGVPAARLGRLLVIEDALRAAVAPPVDSTMTKDA